MTKLYNFARSRIGTGIPPSDCTGAAFISNPVIPPRADGCCMTSSHGKRLISVVCMPVFCRVPAGSNHPLPGAIAWRFLAIPACMAAGFPFAASSPQGEQFRLQADPLHARPRSSRRPQPPFFHDLSGKKNRWPTWPSTCVPAAPLTVAAINGSPRLRLTSRALAMPCSTILPQRLISCLAPTPVSMASLASPTRLCSRPRSAIPVCAASSGSMIAIFAKRAQ